MWYILAMHCYIQNNYDRDMTAIFGGQTERVSVKPDRLVGGFAL